MSANMMEILKQIQRDLAEQKEYMRNLHVIHKNINEKFNNMERKMDQQHVIIEKLEEQVRKNNMLLFGNDEAVANIEATIVSDKSANDNDERVDLPEKSLKNMEITETSKLQNTVPEEIENNRKASNTIAALDKPDLDDEVKSPAEQYEKCIETTATVQQQNLTVTDTEETECEGDNKTNDEKLDSDKHDAGESIVLHELREIKELIRDYIATKKSANEQAASKVREQKTVQISSTALLPGQIGKLNEELKQEGEKYMSTDIFPIMQVVPGPIHHVLIDLHLGVSFNATHSYLPKYTIKLGTKGFKRTEIVEMLTENPSSTLYDVVKEGLTVRNEWGELSKKYYFSTAYVQGVAKSSSSSW